MRHIESTFGVLNLEEAPPCIIPAEQSFKACWKVNHLIFSLNVHVNAAGYQQSDHPPLPFVDISWTFLVFLLAFVDFLYVCFQVGFSGQTLGCRACHPLQSCRRRVLSCLYGWSLCVFSGWLFWPNARLQGSSIRCSPVQLQTCFFLAFMDGLYMCLFRSAFLAKRLIAGLTIRSSPVADVFFLAFMDGLYVSFQVAFPGQTLWLQGLPSCSSPVANVFFLAFMDGLYVFFHFFRHGRAGFHVCVQVAFLAKRLVAGLAIRSSPVANVVAGLFLAFMAFMDDLYVFFQVGFPAKCLIAGLAICSSPVANVIFLAFSSPVADVFFLAFMDGLYVFFQVAFPANAWFGQFQSCCKRFLAFMNGLYVQGWPFAPVQSQTCFFLPS